MSIWIRITNHRPVMGLAHWLAIGVAGLVFTSVSNAQETRWEIADGLPGHVNASTPDSWQVPANKITLGTLDRLHGPLLRRDLRIDAAQSCAASNCHGGPRPGVAQRTAVRGNEFQVWREDDPHSRSWRTICGDESMAIMSRLGIMRDGAIVDQAGFDNCLACHNTTQRYTEPRLARSHDEVGIRPSQSELREGVGCAACHGPSEQWRDSHYQTDWSAIESNGLVNNSDLFTRARMCASCHVGDKDRDMNHDIIAAGHPVLRYEMATYHAWQPKHWRDVEAADVKCYESKLWLAGQIAATDASLSLLVARAEEAHTVSVWPDLSAYDCASCHHELGFDNRREPSDRGRQATARYSQWNDSGLRWVIDQRVSQGVSTAADWELLAALDQVVEVMESQARPDAGSVSLAATHARRTLATWFDTESGQHERNCFSSDQLGQVIREAAGRESTFRTWESATQYYLAVVAARASWPGGVAGPMEDASDRLRFGLRYPDMIDISRYEVRQSNQPDQLRPTLTREQAVLLGAELASWFGPVAMPQSPEVDDSSIEDDERTLRDVAERIRQIWNDRAKERKAKITEIQAILDAKEKAEPEIKDDATKPSKTDQQRIEELQQRLKKATDSLNENIDQDPEETNE